MSRADQREDRRTAPGAAGRRSVKVVTWNIKFGEDIAGASRDLRSIESVAGADIVLLQEMDAPGVATIAEHLGMDHRYFSAADHRQTGRPFGNAVLSPWPLLNAAEVSLPHTARISGQPRSAARADVSIDGVSVTAYSVHTEVPLLRLARRAEQFGHLAADCVGMGSGPIVVGGDFNTSGRRARQVLRAAMAEAGLRDVCGDGAPTCERFGRGFRLDHVLARGLEAERGGVATAASASDHAPVWAVLTLPGADPT